MRRAMYMDDHAEVVCQPVIGQVGNSYLSKSACEKHKSKFLDRQSVNSHICEASNKRWVESSTRFKVECIPVASVTTALSVEKQRKKHVVGEVQGSNNLPAKLVLLKWWLNTLGQNKPTRTAWDDDEHCIKPSEESHIKSPIFVDRLALSCCHSQHNKVCMSATKFDSCAETSMSNAETHRKQKTHSQSLRPCFKSLSSDMSVKQAFSLNQQFIENDARENHMKCTRPNHNQTLDQWPRYDETQSWQTTKYNVRHMHDTNASSNVASALISSCTSFADSHLNKVDFGSECQVQDLLVNEPKSSEKVTSSQRHCKLNMKNTEKSICGQNGKTNSQLLLASSLQSQMSSGGCPFSANRQDMLRAVTPQTNEHEKTAPRDHQGTQLTSTLEDIHNCISDADNSNSGQCKCYYEKSHDNISFYDINREISTTQCDKYYDLPASKTLQDSHNASNSSLHHSEGDTYKDLEEGCLSFNNSMNLGKMVPSLHLQVRRPMPVVHENGNPLQSSQASKATLLKSDSSCKENVSVHEEVNMKLSVSYFSRLVEKRFRAKEHVNNNHQDILHNAQITCNGYANVQDQSVSEPSSNSHNRQSKDKSQSSPAIVNESMNSDNLVTGKHSLPDELGEGHTVPDCKCAGSQHLPDLSINLPLRTECSCSNDCACHIKHMPASTDHHKSDQFQLLEKSGSNQSKFSKPAEDSSASNYKTNNYCSSEYSIINSTSKNSSDTDDQKFEKFEWAAGSWSNTSLPPRQCSGFQTSQPNFQARHTSSTTNTKVQRQTEILKRARLLILMLDKLPMNDIIWKKRFFPKSERCETFTKLKFAGAMRQQKTSKSPSNCSHMISALKKHNSYNKVNLSIQMKNEGNQLSSTRSTSEKTTSNSENKPELCLCSDITPASRNRSNQEPNIKGTNTSFSNMSDIDKSTALETLVISKKSIQKPFEPDCMKAVNKLSKVECDKQQTLPEGTSTHEPQRVSYKMSPICFSEKIPHSFGSSQTKLAAQTVSMSQKSESNASSDKPESDKPTSKKLFNSSDNIMNETYAKKRASNRLSKEQSHRQTETNISKVASENRPENTSTCSPFGLETNSVPHGMLSCHKPRPPPIKSSEKVISDNSQIKISSFLLPILNKKTPVYPKPRPHALGSVEDGDVVESSDLPTTPVASELSIADCKRQSWKKTSEKNNLKTSENCVISTSLYSKCQGMKYVETLNVLPPLQCIHSENIASETNSEKVTIQQLEIPKSATLQVQHEKVEHQQHSYGTKQYGHSLEHSDSVPKSQTRPKCISPEHLRKIYKKTPILSAHNPGMLLSPLRRKFDRMRYKVSDSLLKINPSPRFKAAFTSHHLYRNFTTDNADIEQNFEVFIPKSDTYDHKSSHIKGENSVENKVCGTSEMSGCNLLINNTAKEIFKVNSQHEISKKATDSTDVDATGNVHEANSSCLDSVKDGKICFESKDISKVCKKSKSHVRRAKCSGTTSLKFLTLLLSDDLGSDEV